MYTECSATAAIQDGGAGIFITYTTGNTEAVNIPTGKHGTNYTPEVETTMKASKTTEESTEDCRDVRWSY